MYACNLSQIFFESYEESDEPIETRSAVAQEHPTIKSIEEPSVSFAIQDNGDFLPDIEVINGDKIVIIKPISHIELKNLQLNE